jgi:signal transduction histidine kinase
MLTSIRSSLRRKVAAVVLLTATVALVVSTIAMLAYEIKSYRDFLENDVTTQTEILARANAPALAFDDPTAATANLALLQHRPNFAAAAIYTADDRLFASYSRSDTLAEIPTTLPAKGFATGGSAEFFYPIVENNTALGTVYVRADYRLADRLFAYALILAVVMLISLAVAGSLSVWLAGSVTKPVLAVTRVANQVIEARDFSLRARKTTADEIGVLVDAFNGMLAEVAERAQALEASNALLRQETRERRSAEAALRAADRRKDEFLATLAHELRNPLAPLVNSVSLLDAYSADARATERAREIIRRQLRHRGRTPRGSLGLDIPLSV